MKAHYRALNFRVPLGIGVLLLTARLMPLPHNGKLAGLPTLCPVKLLTGYPCPGCGMTRSLVLCAHGQWAQAWNFHPMGPVLFVVLFCILIVGLLLTNRQDIQARVLQPRRIMPVAVVFFVALIVVWIVRGANIIPYPPNF